MSNSRRRRYAAIFAIAFVWAPFGCSLLAPSDQELMGGLSKETEGGADGSEGGGDGGERDVVCRATNETCTTNGDCCSGRCRGNSTCN